MKKKSKKITRRTFLKTGLAAGGLGVFGVPAFLHTQPKEVKIDLLAPLTKNSTY